jgi:V/A-type H+-transporting ATPase subunit C
MSSGASNVEYVTARVRARRAALFGSEEYNRLLRMGPSEVARFMEETEYEREVNALGARYSGVDLIEYALNRNLARHFNDLLRWCDGRLYEQVARYLRKFDAWNLKTVLRGLYAGTDEQTIQDDIIRAGELGEDTIDRLIASESVEAALDIVEETMFGDRLEAARDAYDESGLLVPLENAIDRAYYEGIVEGVSDTEDRAQQLYVEFLRAEIDFRNLRNALRLARTGTDLDPAAYFIEGGALFDESDIRSMTASPDELVERVRESRYGDQLADALDSLSTAETLIGFEHALDEALLEYSEQLAYRYPLSVCPVLAYVLAKEREVDNIRAIARGREAGLTEEEIEEELVML